MLDLAMRQDDAPVSTTALAETTGISAQFIEQILRPLKQAGLIASVRGANGGHSLNRPPDAISLGEIVRTMEGSANIAGCLDCDTTCVRAEDCLTRSAWERASRAMERELDSITLTDLMPGGECASLE
jgi:Rrf2 family protein